MKTLATIAAEPALVAQAAKAAEDAGYQGVWTGETNHDPFLSMLLAGEHTDRVEIGTSIAVAFARSPMTVALTANDLQQFSGGRFVLGLGSQIRPHIERRYSMPWSQPAARMREFVSAMRAIWASWLDGAKLDFRGDFYTHTLMSPMFDPGPHPFGPPKVFLAGVGTKMTAVAGEVCDGFIVHSFSTPRYFADVTRPALDEGCARSGRDGVEVAWSVFVVTGDTEEAVVHAAGKTKAQLAFYASTPAYRPVLDLHGWGSLHDELHALSKQGHWADMGRAVPDEVLHAFAVVGAPDDIAGELERRYGDLVDRIGLYAPYDVQPGVLDRIAQSLPTVRTGRER